MERHTKNLMGSGKEILKISLKNKFKGKKGIDAKQGLFPED